MKVDWLWFFMRKILKTLFGNLCVPWAALGWMQIAIIFENMAEKSSLVQVLPEVSSLGAPFYVRTWQGNLWKVLMFREGPSLTHTRTWWPGAAGLLGQWTFLGEKKRGKGHLFNGVCITPSTKTWTNMASPLWTNYKRTDQFERIFFSTLGRVPWWRNLYRRIVFGRALHWGRELMPFWRYTVQITYIYYVRAYITTYILFTILRVNRW